MSNENLGNVVSQIKAAVEASLEKRNAVLAAQAAVLAAKREYSEACELVANTIPGDNKSVMYTVDGTKTKLTYSKAGKGGGFSIRGLGRDEPEEIVDLG